MRPRAWRVCSGAGSLRRPSPPALVLGRGCPRASTTGWGHCCLWNEEMGSAVRWVPRASAFHPSGLCCLSQAVCFPPFLFPTPWPPEAQLLSRGLGTELALSTVLVTPWKENDQDMAPPPPSTAVRVRVLKGAGCLVALYWPLLAVPCGSQEGCPWEEYLDLSVSFIHSLPRTRPSTGPALMTQPA